MKKILLFAVATAFSLCLSAQDVIVTRDAKKIQSKIIDVELEVIKYKNFDNLEGPTYTLKKTDIASIIYANGQVDVFEAPAKQQNAGNGNYGQFKMGKYDKNGSSFDYEYRSAKVLKTTGTVMSCVGAATVVASFFVGLFDEPVIGFVVMMPIGLVFEGVGIPCAIVGDRRMREMQMYRQQTSSLNFKINDKTSLGFSAGGNSMRLVLNF